MRTNPTSAMHESRDRSDVDPDQAARRWFVSSPIPMWVYDRSTLRFLDVNDAATGTYGWSKSDFMTMSIADIRPPDDVPRLLRSASGDRSDFQDSGPWTHVTKSGEHRHVHIYSHTIDHAGEPAVLVAAVDVTADHLSEKRVQAQFDLGALAATAGLDGFLHHAAEVVSDVLDRARVGIHLVDDDTRLIVTSATHDVLDRIEHDIGDLIELPAQNLITRVITSCREAVANDIADITAADRSDLRNAALERYAIVPILQRGRCLAVVVATNKITPFTAHDINTMSVLGDLVLHLLDGLESEEATRQALAKYRAATWAAVSALTRVTEARDPYTAGHQLRVADLSVAIGAELGLDADHLDFLKVAGSLHDIGKTGIPAEILSKPGALHPIEIQLIRMHPESGAGILAEIDFPWPVRDVVLQHHERLDGSGYPKGLVGDQISFESRIVAVADVVEAMCSHRPYRTALHLSSAVDELSTGRGTRYDTDVVSAALRILPEWHSRTYPAAD